MESVEFGPNTLLTLTKSKVKYWRIEHAKKCLTITKGVLNKQKETLEETHSIKFITSDRALKRARKLISSKLSKGYAPSSSDTFEGEYLEKGSDYQKIQVHGISVKVEKRESTASQSSVYTYKTPQEAIQKAKNFIRQALSQGYKRNASKFHYNYDASELSKTMILEDTPSAPVSQPMINVEGMVEISSDDDEEPQKAALKRSALVDVDKLNITPQDALMMSALNTQQIVEDEDNNGMVTSYVFDKPQSDKTSELTDIIQESDNNEEIPLKRSRQELPSVQDMLRTIGLERFVHNFEDKGIDSEAFVNLNDSSLHELGIPKRARDKILKSNRDASWDPVLLQSIIRPYEEESKFNKKRKFGDSEVPRNFNPEKGKGKPPEFIQVMLAHTWSEDVDPTGWWLSEKVDGVRCYWNGRHMLSRNGNKFSAPAFFTKQLPKTVSLDGELWMGRKMFQDTISIVKRQDEQKYDMNEWAKIIYLIFDAPSIKGPFEDRLQYMKHLCEHLQSPYVRAHEHSVCTGSEQMQEELERVEQQGGEGLMLRKPDSAYENRRSKSLLKVKTFQDAEATVIKIEKGTGRCANMMGALRVINQDGVEFKIGTGFSDDDRMHPPKIGTKVTYKYQELTKKGTPRFPVFLRIHPGL